MAVVEHFSNTNDPSDHELYELRDEDDRFGGMIIDQRVAQVLEREGLAIVSANAGSLAVESALTS